MISSFLLKLFDEKRFVKSVKVFSANLKSINPIQKYSHIIESYACILKIFVAMLLFYEAEDKGRLIDALISFGICSTPKQSKQVTSLFITQKATQ